MKAKKSFGQHFLRDQAVVKKIIDAAEIQSGETVLEIGPGEGVLTVALVKAGAHVVAIEADRDLIPHLQERFGDAITLVRGDALTVPSAALCLPSAPYKFVSNLPYNVGTAILERFLADASHPPMRLVVMLQREVGERILAKPPDMGLLSVACQVYADAKRVVRVSPGAFVPPPKVESLVIRLDRNPKCQDPEAVLAIAKAAFAHPRKQLSRHVFGGAGSQKVREFLLSRGLSGKARAQELSVDDWVALASFRVL